MQPSRGNTRPTSWAQMSAQSSGNGSNAARSSSSSLSSTMSSSAAGLQSAGQQQGGSQPLAATYSSSSYSSVGSSATNSGPSGVAPLDGILNSPSALRLVGPLAELGLADPATQLMLQQQQQQVGDEALQQQQEENRKLRLQLYVFVLRCISYSFNAKPTNTSELHQRQRQLKLRKPQLDTIVRLHTRFVRTPSVSFAPSRCPHQHLKLAASQLRQLDELYERAHLLFNRKFLQNERMKLLVESECCSQQDLRELFRHCVERTLQESQLFNSHQSSTGSVRHHQQPQATGVSIYQDQQQQQQNNALLLATNRDALINSWLIKFESIIRDEGQGAEGGSAGETSPASLSTSLAASHAAANSQKEGKEQLYQMFQNILNIKKFEHQLLYNALQLDSADEQAAAIRRELDGRVARIGELERNKKLMPKFVLKEMESLYLEETRMSVNKLMVNLDSLPVMKGSGSGGQESRGVYGLQKFRRYNNRAQASLTRDGLVESHPSEPQLSKLDVVLSFNIEVIVMEVRGLKQSAANREIYCTMEIEGSERLQTEHVQAKKPLWDTQGDFTTNHPLPVLKIKLYAVNPSMLSLEDKELGKLVLRPTVLSPKTPEWCTMQPSSSIASSSTGGGSSSTSTGQLDGSEPGGQEELKIRVIVRMDRPQQLKHCGYLYGIGKSTWRKLKRRYHVLIQVSQYTFVMCAYREKKAKPTEMLQLDGYTVDYIEPPTDLIMEHCSEVASSADTAGGHGSSSGPSAFGLAGRLASAILKQPTGGSSSSQFNDDCGGQRADGGAQDDQQQQQPSAIQTAAALSDELHSKFYFNVVKEGDSVVFACDDEQECFSWVMALYRATGQAHKPTPLRRDLYGGGGTSHYLDAAFAYNNAHSQPSKLTNVPTALNGSKSGHSHCGLDVADQRARKHGMDEFISADSCKFQHNQLFKYLQQETLRYRLDDPYCSMGWFSPGQVLVLDEYCARYGVRTCFRHLAYLDSLLDSNQRGYFIDHTLLNYGYDFCASHVSGNSGQAHPISSVNFDLRPDGVGTVTVEERDLFHAIKAKLLRMIERQISNFSYCFPFGKPDGALKATLSLLERVLMKEQQTGSMVQNEEVRQLIRKCLEQAALNNYTKLSGQANLLSDDQMQSASELAGSNRCTPDPQESAQQEGGRSRALSSISTSSAGSYGSSSLNSTATESAHRRQVARQSTAGELEPTTFNSAVNQCLTMAMIINSDQFKPRDKLRYLIRLAELCCEQVEENNDYFSDSFAWHSDLMMDHFELFWSLFSVDMDKILNELAGSFGPISPSPQQQQPPVSLGASSMASQLSQAGRSGVGSFSGPSGGEVSTSREVFALFQVLNNHMRKSPNLECRKFKAYLCDMFKPKLLRYIDISESTLTRILFKASEKDSHINFTLIEQLFAKLSDLQRFVLLQLRWPDDQLAEQLHQRLKLIAYELCDACVQRTLQAFQQTERKSNKWTATSTSYTSPTDMIQMINLVLETRNRSQKLCTFNNFDQMSYHSKIDKLVDSALEEMQPGLMTKLLSALDSTLTKLARFDEGNLLAPILSLTYKQGMSSSGRDIGKQYVTFVSNCCDLLRHKINDELWIVNLLEEWYAAQINVICTWLAERIDHSLHDVQLVALTNIMPKIYADMSLQGVSENKLNLKSYQTIMSRLKMEEASAAAGGGSMFEQPSASIFNTSILSSLTSSSSTASNEGAAATAGAAGQRPAGGPTAGRFREGSRTSEAAVLGSSRLSRFDQQQRPGTPPLTAADPNDQSENIADRALQSATRMFKGFWPNG